MPFYDPSGVMPGGASYGSMPPLGGGGDIPFTTNEPTEGDPYAAESPPLVQPPAPRRIPAPPPTKAEQKEAFEWLAKRLKESANTVQQALPMHRLLEKLAKNEIGRKEWQAEYNGLRSVSISQSRKDKAVALQDAENKEDGFWSNYIHSPAYIVDSFVANAFQQIFSGPEWLLVLGGTSPAPQSEDRSWPTARKVQKFLVEKLEKGHIHSRVAGALKEGTRYRAIYSKVSWYEKEILEWYEEIDPLTGEISQYPVPRIIYSCPVLHNIPFDQFLPDPRARHNDLQRWRFVGHWVNRSYEECLHDYDTGKYTLNQKEFEEQFQDATEDDESSTAEDLENAAVESDREDTTTGQLRIWEAHARFPVKKRGFVEGYATIATKTGVDDPTDGVLVRLVFEPMLANGMRPFVGWHYTNEEAPLGKGAIEGEQDILFLISEFAAQLQDNARLTGQGRYKCVEDSPAWNFIEKYKGKLPPGLTIPVSKLEDIGPFDPPGFNADITSQIVQWLTGWLERRTMATDNRLGMGGSGMESATEAGIVQQQAAVPTATRLDLFARDFLEPLGTIALAMIQRFVFEEEEFLVLDEQGQTVPLTITPEELQGQFVVRAALTRRDALSVAKAQILKELLLDTQTLQMQLQPYGMRVDVGVLVTRLFDLIIDNSDRILVRESSYEQQQQMMIQDLQMQVDQLVQQLQSQPVPTPSNGNGNGKPPQPKGMMSEPGPMGGMTDADAAAKTIQENMQNRTPWGPA